MQKPDDSTKGEITRLLESVGQGDLDAKARLVDALYSELRGMASRQLRANRANHTLQPTALVHEAYLKMLGGDSAPLKNREHFFAVAARVMRQVLIDYARARTREKRGGGSPVVQLEDATVFDQGQPKEILDLNEALERLEDKDPRVHRVVELRFFGGLSVDETAEVLELSPRTVKREWSLGRAWLRGELRQEAPKVAG